MSNDNLSAIGEHVPGRGDFGVKVLALVTFNLLLDQKQNILTPAICELSASEADGIFETAG